jgi:BirA family biotin operon repressor/biotin-[acetyl-CoA-carboxylase] ligase
MTRTTVLDPSAVVAALAAVVDEGGSSSVVFPEPVLPAVTGSTNDDLAASDAGHLALVATLEQRSGKGRLDRDWVAPPGACLTFSVNLVAPLGLSPDALGWITVLTAVACARTVNEVAGREAAAVKWPNDLILDGKKVAGILARLVPGSGSTPHRVVVGVGLNLDQTREELPVGTATSLGLQGIQADPSQLLGRLWAAIGHAADEFFAAGGDVQTPLSSLAGADGSASGLLQAAERTSSTLGSDVRVHLPGGRDLQGTAVALGADGCLVVRDALGQNHHVHAGDVVHLRRSDGGYV